MAEKYDKSQDFLDSIPKYLKIRNYLRDKIRGRLLLPGDKLPTEKELREKFGVSQICVRSALKKLNQEGLIASYRGKGSFVNTPPVVFDPPKPAVIGFYTTINRSHLSSFPDLLKGITMASQLYGVSLQIIHPTPGALHIRHDSQLQAMIESGEIQGLIVDYPMEPYTQGATWEDFHYLEKSGISYQLFGKFKCGQGRNFSSTQNALWLEKIMQHMQQRGYRKVALVLGAMDTPEQFSISTSQGMLQVYKRMMRDSFIPLESDYVLKGEVSVESGIIAGTKLLGLDTPPEVVICCDDYNAAGVIKVAFDLGVKVPHDLKVWGTGDIMSPSIISTVTDDWEKIGREVVTRLIQLIEDGFTEDRIETNSLVFRESTADDADEAVVREWVHHYLQQHPLSSEKLQLLEQQIQPLGFNLKLL